MILTVYERSSLRMQICRIRRWRRMGGRRVAPVIGWQRIFAGRWRGWLIINDSGATPGGPAARRRSASPAGLLIAIVLPEKIPSLRNVRRQSKDEYIYTTVPARRTSGRSYRPPFLLCVREDDEEEVARKGTSYQKQSYHKYLTRNRLQPWQESKFTSSKE